MTWPISSCASASCGDARVTWQTLGFLREHWPGTLIVKGILDAEDARTAACAGVDSIVVSNHGGRQLDGTPSTIRALPAIVEAVGDRPTVLADGGVRSGLDAAKMLASGAKGVMIGRTWAYALAAEGERGVSRMLSILKAELRIAMALTGTTQASAFDQSALVRR
ncbi:alpha-hydroxy-acid oxidizing protein [Sphingomonas aracearum]|uniref:alpha-hydroxy-acid oxidizing protein n=1 Tax=Sphingomonas aracearum TaxID=2283317 RepID=UPI0026C98231